MRNRLNWVSGNELRVDDLIFQVGSEFSSAQASGKRFPLIKNREFLERMFDAIAPHMPVRHMLEIGMLQGGSALLFEKSAQAGTARQHRPA